MKKQILMLALILSATMCNSQTITATTNHSISLSDASVMTKAYRDAGLNYNNSERFGKDAIQSIINQAGCVGIKIYFAKDTNGLLKVVIVGIQTGSNGYNMDMYNGILADRGYCCGAEQTCCIYSMDENPLNTD